MDRGGTESGEGENRGQRGGRPERHMRASGELGEGSGFGADIFLGWSIVRGGDVAGGSPYPQGEEGVPGHRPRGGGVEGIGGNSKFPFHILHHLTRRPPWI